MAPKASTPRPNVLSANCPTRAVLDLIADKWTALVIHVLADGTHRPPARPRLPDSRPCPLQK